MVHAFDDCYGDIDDGCKQRLCAEIRAYSFSGQCDGIEVPPYLGTTEQAREICILDLAKISARDSGLCNGIDLDAMAKQLENSCILPSGNPVFGPLSPPYSPIITP